MLRLLVALFATAVVASAGSAQVTYPPRPESFDVQLRYRIRADRDERIRQYRELQRHLKSLDFVEVAREDGDLDVFDGAAEAFSGTLPSANLDRLFGNPNVATAVAVPAGQALPADGKTPVAVRVRIAAGFGRAEQRNLHEQVVRQLGLLGFRESVSYDTAGDTLIRGTLPGENVLKLTKDLRTLPSGWFLPAVALDQQPAPLRTTLPIRTVEVLTTSPAAAEVAPAPAAPAAQAASPKLTPDARAVAEDAANAGRPQRFDLVLDEAPGDGWTALRDRLRAAAENLSVEGLVGRVVTVRVARTADVAKLADVLEVRSIRLPRLGSPTVAPAAAGAKLPAVADLLAQSRVETLHRLGYRGLGQHVVLVGTDFAGVLASGKALPAGVELLDLTAELSPDLTPDPAAGGTGVGTLAAQVVHASAPEARLTLVRISPAAFAQLYGLARVVAGDRASSEAMQTRAFELTRRTVVLTARRSAVLDEYSKAFGDLGDEDRTAARRAAARKALDDLSADEKDFRAVVDRFDRLNAKLDGLRGASVVVNTLVWDTGYPQDGLNELSRLIDARYAPAPRQSALRTLKGPPAPVWVQAAGVNAAQVWSGPFLDADGNGVMEFAPESVAVPKSRWTRELNFLDLPTPDGKPAETLPAGMQLRLTIQWREPQDPGGFLPREPVLPFTLRLLRQLDPTGKAAATDDFEEVGRSAGEPVKLLRTPASGAFEQTLELTLPAAGVYALRVDARPAFDYPLAALRQRIEVSPRVVIERVGPDAAKGTPAFRTFPGGRDGVGTPGDSLTALTIGTSDGRTQRGTGPGVTLGAKPDLVAAGGVTLGANSLTGTAASAAFVGGSAAALASAGVRATDLTRHFGLTPGGEFVLPEEWLRSLSPSRRER